MSSQKDPLFTKRFTAGDSFTLTADDGISKYSLKVVTGTATLTGTKKIQGISSDPITMEEGDTFSGSSQNAACCLTLVVAGGSVVDFAASSE